MSVKSQPQRTRYASMEMDEVESVVVVGVGSGFLFARVVHTRIDKVYTLTPKLGTLGLNK